MGRVFESEQLSAGERAALKTLTLRSRNAPPLLAVHVKRFAFDTASGSMTKVRIFIKDHRWMIGFMLDSYFRSFEVGYVCSANPAGVAPSSDGRGP